MVDIAEYALDVKSLNSYSRPCDSFYGYLLFCSRRCLKMGLFQEQA